MAGLATIMKFVACGGQARTSQRQAGGASVVLDATVISALLVHSAWTPSSVPRMGMRHLSVMRAPPMEAHKLEALRKIEECCTPSELLLFQLRELCPDVMGRGLSTSWLGTE